MKTVYTTTITDEARRRGIRVEVIDAVTPIFVLRHRGRAIRCYNALTDRVGAVTFHLAQHKRLANQFLRAHGFPVPAQALYTDQPCAERFLARYGSVVVKPCAQWGGRGVSVAVRDADELRQAVRLARRFEEDVVLEQCVSGVDQRLIFINYRFVAAIQRNPARVEGNGRDPLRTLILRANRAFRALDPSHRIPLDAETRRNLAALGFSLEFVPAAGMRAQVRLTSNYHTGGSVDVITGSVSGPLIDAGRRIARLLQLPVLGVDFLVDATRRKYWAIELSPDLAISPPEGAEVARRFLDYLFPDTRGARGVG